MKGKPGIKQFHRQAAEKQAKAESNIKGNRMANLVNHRYYGGFGGIMPSYSFNIMFSVASLFPVDSIAYYKSASASGLIALTRMVLADKKTKFIAPNTTFTRAASVVEAVFSEGKKSEAVDDLALFLVHKAVTLYCVIARGDHKFLDSSAVLDALVIIACTETWERYKHIYELKSGKDGTKYTKTGEIGSEIYGRLTHVNGANVLVDFMNKLMQVQDSIFDTAEENRHTALLSAAFTVKDEMGRWVKDKYPNIEHLPTVIDILVSETHEELDSFGDRIPSENKEIYGEFKAKYSDEYYAVCKEYKSMLIIEAVEIEHYRLLEEAKADADSVRKLLKTSKAEVKKLSAEAKTEAEKAKTAENKYTQSMQELKAALAREDELKSEQSGVKERESLVREAEDQLAELLESEKLLREEVEVLRSELEIANKKMSKDQELVQQANEIKEMATKKLQLAEDYRYIADESQKAITTNDREYEKIRLKRMVLLANKLDISEDVLEQFQNLTVIDMGSVNVNNGSIRDCDVVVVHSKYKDAPLASECAYKDVPVVYMDILNSKLLIHRVHEELYRGTVLLST